MTTRPRALFLAVLAALAVAVAPAGAATAPERFVSGRADGALVSFAIDSSGAVRGERVLVPPSADTVRIPAQVRRGTASMLVARGDRMDTVFVDAASGRVTGGYRDGRTGQVVVSPDGRHHYLLKSDREGGLSALVQTDARGRNARTLIAPEYPIQLSGLSVSPDGRTVYVARTHDELQPSALYAIDTVTGKRRTISYVAPYLWLINAVVSPDGKTLAVSFADDVSQQIKVGLLDVAGGPVRLFDVAGDTIATAFSARGDRVLLTTWTPTGSRLAVADATTMLTKPVGNSTGLRNAVPLT